MGIGTAIGVGGAAIGAGISGSHGASSAANAQVAAADQAAQLQYQEAQQALDFEKQVFAQQQVNEAPWLQGGSSAIVNLSNLLGIMPSTYNSTPVPVPQTQNTTAPNPFATPGAQLTVPAGGNGAAAQGAQSFFPTSSLLAGVNPADFSAKLLPGFGTPSPGNLSDDAQGTQGTPRLDGGPTPAPNQGPMTIGPGGITSVGGPNGPPIESLNSGAPGTGQGATNLQSVLDRLPGRAQPLSGALEMPVTDGGSANSGFRNPDIGNILGGNPGNATTQSPAQPSVPCGGAATTTVAGGPTPTPTPTSPQPTPTPTPSPTPAPSPSPLPSPSPSPTPPTWSPQTSSLPAPPAQEPPPPPGSDFPLTISSPSDGSAVNSPANVVATATPTNPILGMRVYVDGLAVYWTFNSSMDTRIWMAPGAHTLEIMAEDKAEDKKGFISASVLNVTVQAQQAATVADVQALPGWQSCSALFPPGSPREGQLCAAGLGTAVSTMTQGQNNPSLDGKSTKFTMGGPTGYSNELWFESLGGGTNVTHFVYDLQFYIDNPNAPQALEFDVNQTFGGLRWTWGTEFNFKGTGKWDIWDPLNEKWVPSQVPCNPFPANTWIRLVWNFERVNGQVHYISVTVNGVTSAVDQFFQPQQNWTLEDINVAFQMDGDFRQDPYNVWLDQVTLQTF